MDLKGRITEVTDDGQGGVVTLEEHVNNHTKAIINDKSKGRLDLLHESSGKLRVGQPVIVHDLCGGWGGIFVLHISK